MISEFDSFTEPNMEGFIHSNYKEEGRENWMFLGFGNGSL